MVGEPDKVQHGVQGGEVAEGGEEERQAGGNLPGKYGFKSTICLLMHFNLRHLFGKYSQDDSISSTFKRF